MCRKKKQVNALKEYWEKEKFDSNTEFLYYQCLCGNIKGKTKINKIDEHNRFRDYKSWRQHIEEILKGYDEDKISEFYHFIKLRERQCDIYMGMNLSMFAPFMVALVAGILVQFEMEMVQSFSQNSFSNVIGIIVYSIMFILGAIILVFVLCFALYAVVNPYVKSKNEVNFWTDCLEVVEEYIKNEKENNREKR